MENYSTSQTILYDEHSGTGKGLSQAAFEEGNDPIENEETISSLKIKDQELDLLLLSCKRTEPKGDINLFENMFQSWKNQAKQTEAVEKDLKQRLEISEKERETADRKITDLEKTVDLLQKAIKSLHTDLDLVDKLGKENVELKESVHKSERNLANEKKEFEQKCISFEKQISEDKVRYENMIKDLQDDMNSKLKEKDTHLHDVLAEKEQDMDKMNQEKESEKQKLTVEYENKLVKLQRQRVTATMNQQQSSSANQEIFRKKLQHLRKEHEAEISNLKEQIKNLQEQLNTSKSTQQIGAQNKPSLSTQPLFKKARRF